MWDALLPAIVARRSGCLGMAVVNSDEGEQQLLYLPTLQLSSRQFCTTIILT
jgi:hypothetical protein